MPNSSKIYFDIDFNHNPAPATTSVINPPHYVNLIAAIALAIIILSVSGIILTSSRKK